MYEDDRAKQAAWKETMQKQSAALGQYGAGVSPSQDITEKEVQEIKLVRVWRRLDYHPPMPHQIPRYQAIRDAAKAFATVIVRNCPVENVDADDALRSIEAAVMQANKAIANA